MTAPDRELHNGSGVGGRLSAADEATQRVEQTCRAVVDGRRAARVLSGWSKRFGLNEPDFQVLWTLRLAASARIDQATLASRLAISPAQVSATVERLRGKRWIVRTPTSGDRRRNLWQLTAHGRRLIERILAEAEQFRRVARPEALRRAWREDYPSSPRPSKTPGVPPDRGDNPQSEEDAA